MAWFEFVPATLHYQFEVIQMLTIKHMQIVLVWTHLAPKIINQNLCYGIFSFIVLVLDPSSQQERRDLLHPETRCYHTTPSEEQAQHLDDVLVVAGAVRLQHHLHRRREVILRTWPLLSSPLRHPDHQPGIQYYKKNFLLLTALLWLDSKAYNEFAFMRVPSWHLK